MEEKSRNLNRKFERVFRKGQKRTTEKNEISNFHPLLSNSDHYSWAGLTTMENADEIVCGRSWRRFFSTLQNKKWWKKTLSTSLMSHSSTNEPENVSSGNCTMLMREEWARHGCKIWKMSVDFFFFLFFSKKLHFFRLIMSLNFIRVQH